MKGYVKCRKCGEKYEIDEVTYRFNLRYDMPNKCPDCEKQPKQTIKTRYEGISLREVLDI